MATLYEAGAKYPGVSSPIAEDVVVQPGQIVELYLTPDREISFYNGYKAMLAAFKIKEKDPDYIIHYIRIDSDLVTIQMSTGTREGSHSPATAGAICAVIIVLALAAVAIIFMLKIAPRLLDGYTPAGTIKLLGEARYYFGEKVFQSWPLPDAVCDKGAPFTFNDKDYQTPWDNGGKAIPAGTYAVPFREIPDCDWLLCQTPTVELTIEDKKHSEEVALYRLIKGPPGGIDLWNPDTGETTHVDEGQSTGGTWPTAASLTVITTPVEGDIYLSGGSYKSAKIGTGRVTVDELPFGEYTVSYGAVPKYITPVPETFSLNADGHTSTGEYKPEKPGWWASLPDWAKGIVAAAGAIGGAIAGIQIIGAITRRRRGGGKKKEEKE